MIIGYNVDITYDSKVYHVQTEDLGRNNPHILTLLYQAGAIVFSKKTDYSKLLGPNPTDAQIQELMRRQHQQIVDALKAGKFSKAKPAAEKEKAKDREFAADLLTSDKSFDQVILEFLSHQDKPKEKK